MQACRSLLMEAFVEKIKQYPAKEQAELKVRVKIPGSWFTGLVGAEKAEMYEAWATSPPRCRPR